MDMIRHHHERVQPISLKPALAVAQSTLYQRGDFRVPENQRADPALVENAVHRPESLAGRRQSSRWEDTACRKTAAQTECDKQRTAYDIPVWQSSFIMPHPDNLVPL